MYHEDFKVLNNRNFEEWEDDVALLVHVDETLWNSLKQPDAKTKSLPLRCKSLFMSLFFTAAMMLAFATTIGYCCEQSVSDVTTLSAADRQCIGEKIEE